MKKEEILEKIPQEIYKFHDITIRDKWICWHSKIEISHSIAIPYTLIKSIEINEITLDISCEFFSLTLWLTSDIMNLQLFDPENLGV